MTPHQLFRESTLRPRSWPPYAWAIVAGAAIAMFVSVVLLAWQASRMARHRHEEGAHASPSTFESAAAIRERLEGTCKMVEGWRATGTGIYSTEFKGSWR